MAVLRVENLTKTYGIGFLKKRYIKAVDNISFTINKGEIVSLVGESGSGKTTTAKMILSLLSPTSGAIIFDEKDIWKDLKKKEDLRWYWRNVHAIFQDPYASYNPLFKAKRVLIQALRLIGVDPRSSEAREIMINALKTVGLKPEVLDKYPHQLSGGERQRLMIARCIIIKPKIIIADEPISMLDASLRARIMKELEKIRDNYGTSIVFITHDMGLAYYISDRIIVMHKGKIVEEGTPDEILDNPKHEYTKELIASIPTLYRKWRDI